jgi:hypothetical protein
VSIKATLKAGTALAQPCQHENFVAHCDVSRLSEEEGGPITGYSVTVGVQCTQCKKKFRFRGIPAGLDPDYPRVSMDGTELRAPMEPEDTPAFAPGATYRLPPKTTLQ